MSSTPNYSEAANRFASVAELFCDAIDSAPNLDRTELLVQIYRILPQLVAVATSLPRVETNEDDESDEEIIKESQSRGRFRVSQALWNQLYELLKVKLGDVNLYWVVLEPTRDKQTDHGSLADDFADIYRDLKPGLSLHQAHQAPPEDMVREWQLGYYSHWGRHAIDALRALHFMLEKSLEDQLLS